MQESNITVTADSMAQMRNAFSLLSPREFSSLCRVVDVNLGKKIEGHTQLTGGPEGSTIKVNDQYSMVKFDIP